MSSRRRNIAGFTLLETLLVVAVIGILVALVYPSTQPTLVEQLDGAARLLATELAYGRSLAVSYNSQYRFTWDTGNNRCVLEYSGTNASLKVLPNSPFRSPSDLPTQHIVDFDDLPHTGPPVQLLAAGTRDAVPAPVSTLEFGPLGGTTGSKRIAIWLTAGAGDRQRYISVEVDPVTGLATVGSFTAVGPPASLLAAAATP